MGKRAFSPLAGPFEKKYHKDAWDIMQKALWASGVRLVIKVNPEIGKALNEIGELYKRRIPDEF